MASLQASALGLLPTSSSSCCCSRKINAVIHVPKLPKAPFSIPKISTTRKLIDKFNNIRVDGFTNTISAPQNINFTTTPFVDDIKAQNSTTFVTIQLYSLLEIVADRVEMHANIGKQRDNWNTLLLNSINMITLTAATMAGVAAIGSAGMPILALKLSSTLLYSAAAGMLLVMNKIQPSQLAEEQRNATRLFKQLQSQIKTILALGATTEEDVKDVMERVLALDRAYPLPLLGAMLDKFPTKFEPATWWPSYQLLQKKTKSQERKQRGNNGWSEELEVEMRDIVEVVKRKDSKDYERLGSQVLKINKILSISGPLLTGIAAVGSACVGNGSWASIVAMVAGALATTANAFQHGGQVGMIFEMYRNNGGFFRLLEETIEATLEEGDLEKRENGELFEMKVALQLGRSLSQLKELARKPASYRLDGTAIDEFASKLF
ncbi:probable F-box protein At4g22030 [Juglans microcarpa x Juglans regia]|uniref:probable F-box protein At4g22030 n=1 Tax=Juglans microcarpa x Juglans regia TaxID=2249226 RepID=UPI001B7E738A|nr:probable F-box protein At4g22030 [Juglans microcarpa x Juglans regia]